MQIFFFFLSEPNFPWVSSLFCFLSFVPVPSLCLHTVTAGWRLSGWREARTQFPCPSLGVVGGTLTQSIFSKAGFFAVYRLFSSAKREAKRPRAAWSRPRRRTPARSLGGWRLGTGGRERREHISGTQTPVTSPWLVLVATFFFSLSVQGRGRILTRT